MEPEQRGMTTTRWAFYVGGKAHVVHQMGEEPGADLYYTALDPASFLYWTVATAHQAREARKLDGGPGVQVEEKAAAHLSAQRFRMHHLNLLETFFAQFFANVQAPDQPAAWLTIYSSTTITKLAKRLTKTNWTHGKTTRVLAHPQEFLGWLFGIVGRSDLDNEERAAEVSAVKTIVGRLASEFTDRGAKMEYNAIKHGARAYSSPWQLGIAPSGAPMPASVLGSGQGSHFGLTKSQCGHVHTWRERSQGWDLERDIRVATLVSHLLFNLVQARRKHQPEQMIAYFNFRQLDVRQLFMRNNRINHFEMGHPDLPEDERMDEAGAQKMADYEQVEFEKWLCKLGDVKES